MISAVSERPYNCPFLLCNQGSNYAVYMTYLLHSFWEHGYSSPFVYYTHEHKSLAPETDSIFFIKHATSYIQELTLSIHAEYIYSMAGHKISGLNPVARSESLAAIFSRTYLI
jgi:hypothetical protein